MAGILKSKASSGGGVLKSKTTTTTNPQQEEQNKLLQIAQQAGVGDQAQEILKPKPKLGILGRLSKGLGAFNPAEALLTGIEQGSILGGIKKYATGIVQGIGSGITGTDYEGTRRTFSDVAEKAGIENKWLKGGIGLIGDVLLDPSTYFGGAIIKGITGGVKGGANLALKGVGKLAPEVETGLRLAGTGLQDAVGRAFQFGYKATGGAVDDVMSFMSKEQKARLGIAASNLNRLGTGALTKEQAEELSLRMIAGKRAEFVAREAGTSLDEAAKIAQQTALKDASPEIAGKITEQIARGKKFAEQLNLENPYETYFPFIKKDKLEKFLKETTGIKVGSEGYRKQFKNLLTNDKLELNPAKAFFTRESQIVHNELTKDFLNSFVGKYGKKLTDFANSDEALKAGYQLIKDKGIFGKEIGYLNKFDTALIRDSLTPEFQTLSMLAKSTGFDAVTSLFKRSVTGLFLPFHVRNYFSGMVQNFETLGVQALNPKNIAVGQKIALLLAKGKKVPKLFQPFADRFGNDTFYHNDFLTALDSGQALKQVQPIFSKQSFIETVKTVGVGQDAIPFKAARAIGGFIEHQQKATAYITAISQGKTVKEALQLVEQAGFDYRALTSFESQVMRRIIPFYSFNRKNLELQFKTLTENPQRINQINKFFENAAETVGQPITQEEYDKLPDYAKDNYLLKTGTDEHGNPIIAQSGFGTPIEAIAQLLTDSPARKVASMTNNLIKVPLEKALGKDFFYNQDINEITDAKNYNVLPDFLKEFIDFREVPKVDKYGKKYTKYVADPEKLHILRNLPTSRLFGYIYDIYRDDVDGGNKALTLSSGVKPKPIDLETVNYFRERDKQKELEDLLIRIGVLKKFERTYVPKSTENP